MKIFHFRVTGRGMVRAPATLLLALAVIFVSLPGGSREVFPGPVEARVLRVLDGDTIHVVARIWLGQRLETKVRLAGVDTPELKGACADERKLAVRARKFLIDKLADGRALLRDVHFGRYAGRVVARVENSDEMDLSGALIRAGLGRPYKDGRRKSWCAKAAKKD